MIHFDNSDYVLVKYYGYTSSVQDVIKREDHFIKEQKNGKLKKLYDDCFTEALIKTECHFHIDNKSVFKLKNIKTNESLFIGMFDNCYTIGRSCYLRFGCTYDFNTMSWSKYVGEDRNRENEY